MGRLRSPIVRYRRAAAIPFGSTPGSVHGVTPLCRPAAGFSTAVAPNSVTNAAAASGMAPTVYATKNPHVIKCVPSCMIPLLIVPHQAQQHLC